MNISRSSRLQMFFKIGSLKNFAIFWIKKSLKHRCFLLNIAKFLRAAFLQNLSGGRFCIILKVIKQGIRTIAALRKIALRLGLRFGSRSGLV